MITIGNTIYETAFKNILQSNVTMYLNNKVWKNGSLILFKQSGYYLELTLRCSDKTIERFEVPIPFEISKTPNKILMSYKLVDLAHNDTTLLNMLKDLPTQKNKFYDSTITIEVR